MLDVLREGCECSLLEMKSFFCHTLWSMALLRFTCSSILVCLNYCNFDS